MSKDADRKEPNSEKFTNKIYTLCIIILSSVYLLYPSNLKDETFTNATNAPNYALRDIDEALAEGTKQVMERRIASLFR